MMSEQHLLLTDRMTSSTPSPLYNAACGTREQRHNKVGSVKEVMVMLVVVRQKSWFALRQAVSGQ
jgi:hypothetical protein